MKILVVGGGGREHAILWKLKQDNPDDEIYCAPGNAGIEGLAKCIPVTPTDIEGLADFAKEENIDLTVVGMDDPLMLGIVDRFEAKGLRIFGPTQRAANIEGSKAFSKEFMKMFNIPTAKYEIFSDSEKAMAYINENKIFPIVIKADGLALGKGVLICNNQTEALDAIKNIMIDKKFGEAGNQIVIEEFMTGQEVSVLAFCDGNHIVPMVSAQDHKRALDGDKGLNTGGMGTFSPSRHYTEEIHKICHEYIYVPTVKGLSTLDRPFKGILFFGLMLTEEGPKLLEYNARFGDPEAQVVLPRLDTNLRDLIEACIDGTLNKVDVEWKEEAAVCVILASGGYPVDYKKGLEIKGLDQVGHKKDICLFHAGTKKEQDKILTNGGRVLGVTALGKDLEEAIERAYQSVAEISFENMHYRRDIGMK